MLRSYFRENVRFTLRGVCRCLSTRALTKRIGEYSDQPEYPAIQDLSFKEKKKREFESWHDKIKLLSSVEEKLFEINMPKYYGYKTHMITDQKFPYNVLPLAQYATRTNFIEEFLPDAFEKLTEDSKIILQTLRGELEDIIGFELGGYKRLDNNMSPEEREEMITSSFVKGLHRVLINHLSNQYGHLNEIEVDFYPRHEAFWFLGGISPPPLVRKIKEGVEWQKPYANDPYDRNLQYIGRPYLALRHKHPLEPLAYVNLDNLDIKQDQIEIPQFKYDPLTLGYHTEQRHATTIPGFWPGELHEFGTISFQRRSHTLLRHTYSVTDDLQEAIHSQAIFASFAWLLGQACYQGFSVFNDLTYPLTTQTIITNGKKWSFYAYQLNTTLLHSDQVDINPRYNICWGTKELELFDHVDDTGKIHGLNEDVLARLITFYINTPKIREGVNLKPYLCKTETRVANILDEKRRVFMEQTYKHRASNRPRHRPVPELYLWEKFYKVDNNTRAMEPKRRPFELDKNMYKRRMDEHALEYIPRRERPGGPKSKPKFETTYYPNVRR
ncbi:39S ribosomal protein S30, mitochondrial [Wyeomyia smithii]|uniref:39S ribosomal protein S30, mitochondrial n=1 Tax=Wyeomyia smithii TaxID=174621 RepID=UPI002467F51E|nr:39S ribosomal protein S30, mitochondrial [Wyeomyia smithii]